MLGQGYPTAPREKAVGLEPPFHATVLGLEVTKLEQMVQEGLGCRVNGDRKAVCRLTWGPTGADTSPGMPRLQILNPCSGQHTHPPALPLLAPKNKSKKTPVWEAQCTQHL